VSDAVWPDIQVYLDVTSAPLSATDLANTGSTTLPRIDAQLLSFQTHRGRSNAQSHFDAGSLTIELDNRDGRFDPTYTSSPFYPHLGVGNHVSIYANTAATWLYSGYITSLQPAYDWTGGERMVITATDLFSPLGLQNWSLRTSYTPATADTVLKDILSDCGFSNGWVTGDTGFSLVQPPTDDPTNPGQTANALQVMQAAAEDTESGLLFVSGQGKIKFWNRYKRPNQTGATTITAGDGGGSEIEYEGDIAPVMDDSLLVNGMTVTTVDGSNHTYSDAASIGQYGPRYNSVSNLMATPTEGDDLATFSVLQQKDARLRIDQVTLRPVYTSLASWTPIMQLDDFGVDTCTVKRRPPSGNVISQDSFIERIDHSFDGTQWETTLGLTPRFITLTQNWLKLNDATLGKLGTGVLGF